MKTYDAIVLGAGGVGSAALAELARRGVRAVGIDRWMPPHGHGSTHGQTRVIRQAYFEHPDYVPLLLESYRRWGALEESAGRQLLHQVGVIQVGPDDGVVVPGVLRAAAEHSLPVERMTADEVQRRWTGLRVPAELSAVFEPRGGYLLVDECVQACLDAAQAGGAELMPGVEVHGWQAERGTVRVETSAGTIAAERLIVAAGAWADGLLDLPRYDDGSKPFELTVRRKSLFWFATDSPDYDEAGGFPVFLFELPGGEFYGFPQIDGRGVKIAEHTGGRVVDDPLTVDREFDADERQRLVDVLAAHLPGVSPRLAEHVVCLYTMSPDEDAIIDRHPLHENVAFAAGLSGHGYKLAPVFGRALVDLAMDGATTLPIEFLSLGRFAEAR